MTVLRVLLGIVLGAVIAFGSIYVTLHFGFHVGAPSVAHSTYGSHGGRGNHPNSPGPNDTVTLIVAGIGASIGAIYSGIAFGREIYGIGVFSILGYLLDMSWSLLNTTASLLVWLPACAVAGGDFVEPDDNSKRSGTFVYRENPRGGGYAATTIGTVIGGGWSSHEEMHTWQARMFGPLYMPAYLLSLFLNMLFRLITGKTADLTTQAYYRICFEDWAYAAGSTSGNNINWGWWFLWLLLSAVYVSSLVLIFVGAFRGIALLTILAAAGLVVYSLIRALIQATA